MKLRKKNRLVGSKRGNMVRDSVTLVVLIFSLFLMVILANASYSFWNDAIQEDDSFDQSIKDDVSFRSAEYSVIWDNVIFLFFIGLWLVAVLSSFLVDSHPVFYVLAILSFSVVIIIAGTLSVFMDDILSDSILVGFSQDFPKTLFIVDNAVGVVMVVALSIGAVLYGKQQFR